MARNVRLNTELIAFLDDTKMDESFRMSLEKRFFNRMMGEGFQIEVMKYLENRVEEYVSSKPERSKAILRNIKSAFNFVELLTMVLLSDTIGHEQ